MQRWAYLVFKMGEDSLAEIQFRLEQLGNEGWELVAIVTDKQHGALFYFKRPKN